MPARFVNKENLETGRDPFASLEWLSKPGLTAAEKLLMVRATMPEGGAHPFHKHPEQEEILYFLEGTAEQWVEGEKQIMNPGDIAHIPAGVVHATFNAGKGDLVFAAILSPAVVSGPVVVDVSTEAPWDTMRV